MLADNWSENSSVCRYYANAAGQGIFITYNNIIISVYKSANVVVQLQ